MLWWRADPLRGERWQTTFIVTAEALRLTDTRAESSHRRQTRRPHTTTSTRQTGGARNNKQESLFSRRTSHDASAVMSETDTELLADWLQLNVTQLTERRQPGKISQKQQETGSKSDLISFILLRHVTYVYRAFINSNYWHLRPFFWHKCIMGNVV